LEKGRRKPLRRKVTWVETKPGLEENNGKEGSIIKKQ